MDNPEPAETIVPPLPPSPAADETPPPAPAVGADAPADAPVRRVRLWHLIVPIAAPLLLLLALSFMAGVMAGLVLGPNSTPKDILDVTTAPQTQYVVLQLVLAAIYLVMLVALRAVLGRVGRLRMVADFVPARPAWIGWGAASGVAMALSVVVITAILSASGVVSFSEGEAERAVLPHSPGQLSMAVATIVILGPYAEELYFRGALLSWLRDKLGMFLAIVLCAALFALAHGQFVTAPGAQGWIATGFLAMVGLVNGVWAYRTHSLWPPFATHAAFNATMIAMALLVPESP